MATTTTGPQRLYLMQVASLPTGNVPVPCYFVQTGDGTNIVIDSGLPEPAMLPPGLTPAMGKDIIEQLAALGVKPADVDLLICTHFDMDHCGHHAAFTEAQFVVQRSHYEHAQSSERFARLRPQWDQPAAKFRFVEGDTELLPGLELIETSGHTLGHQSVLVRLPRSGAVLLTIDAVKAERFFSPDREMTPFDEDETATRASTRKLLELARREEVSLVVFGHDSQQWQTLRLAPDYYE